MHRLIIGLGRWPLLVVVASSCVTPSAGDPAPSRSPSAPAEPPRAPKSPETAFEELEEALAQGPLHMRFEVTAEGAVEVSLEGELRLDEEIELSARGRFAGRDVDVHLWTQGDRLRAGPADATVFDLPRPTALAPALRVGLTRMGILHNLAMLIGGAPPDHADGGVAKWVVTVDHRRPDRGDRPGDGLQFGLVVGGQPSGEATLWLDAQGVPLEREQVVDFPDGQMRVTERYEVLASSLRSPGTG